MKIPKSFKIAGKTYAVKIDNDGRLLEQKLAGQVNYTACTIKISLTDGLSISSKECVQHTYLHEIWHTIWEILGEVDLKSDERRADAFCNLLLQVLNSGKGELKI
jgi:hypothetical protein